MDATPTKCLPNYRPILFSGPMAQAILAGRKTQTRRAMKPQPAPNSPHDGGTSWLYSATDGLHIPCGTVGHLTTAQKMGVRCPCGQPGDRLWVRERARVLESRYHFSEALVRYEADGAEAWVQYPDRLTRTTEGHCIANGVHREGARTSLEVVSVRVERLQDISEEDARAEGVERHPEPFTRGWRNYEPSPAFESVTYHPTARESFASLWRSIYSAESWDANPWVWAVTFRRVEGR